MVPNPSDLGRTIQWKLVSKEYLPNDRIVSLFEAPTALDNRTYRLSQTVTPDGEYGHYSVI